MNLPPKSPEQSDNNDLRQHSFRLQDMVKTSTDLWVFSWLLGLVFAISIVALLMISGWFITGAALAGMIAVGSHAFNYMLPAGIIRMLAIARTASRYGELMVAHNAVFNLLKALRVRFFDHLSRLPLSFQRGALQSSQAMHRLVSDIDKLDEFILRVVSPWIIAIITIVLLTSFITIILPISLTAKGLIVLGMITALIVPSLASYAGIKQAHILAQTSEARRHKLLAPLSIIIQLLLWRQWYTQTQPYIAEDKKLHQLEWQAQKRRSLYTLIMQWIIYFCIVVVLASVAILDNQYATLPNLQPNYSLTINVPILLAVVLGLMGVLEIILPLAQHYLSLGSSLSAKTRLNNLLINNDQSDKVVSEEIMGNKIVNNKVVNMNTSNLPLPSTNLTLTLANVSAKIPTALVGAKEVNVTIKSGTPLIIKGPSGCGKSTLLQMLAGELPLLSGEVLLNDQPWHSYDWQDQLGYLGQQLDIFDQSLADNLKLGKKDATDDELKYILDKVGLSEWLNAQPQGLATPLGEYGAYISGGQARRIALARLLLKPRKILLLDEPFAGLDTSTQSQLWQYLQAHQQNGILVIVSHQAWNMQDCNILMLQTQVFDS